MNDTTHNQPETSLQLTQPMTPRQQAMVEADTADMFCTLGGFDLAHRMARTLSGSTLLPPQYQGENGVSNCLVLLDIASRFKKLNISPFTVAQQLVVVHGKPAWQGQFVIAIINLSGRFSQPMQFAFDGEGQQFGCTAWTTDHAGNKVEGTKITREMVLAEGWNKNSKWKNMERQMFMYRAASFFGRAHVPDLLMGYQTSDEVEDVTRAPKDVTTSQATADLIGAIKGEAA